MSHGKRKKKLHFSKIYTFDCGKASLQHDEHSQIGGSGFSRVVFCNEPESFDSSIHNYPNNYLGTTKYTLATFIPKSLFEQFRRVARHWYLIFHPLASYTTGHFAILCLAGSYLVAETGGHNRIGGVNVSISSPDGHVMGGVVGGRLTA